MLLEEENSPNKIEHRTDLLTDKYTPYTNVDNGLVKELLLLLVGNIFTLTLIATIVALILFNVNEIDRKCLTEIISYAVLFGALMGILGSSIKKYLPKFANWTPYVVGLGFGLAVLGIDELYIRVVNMFYTTGVGGNEAGVRMVIQNYPVLSVFIFGLIGPMCEELTYRVGLFGLLKRWNRIWAYVITSLVFGFIHMQFDGNIATEFILLPSYLIPGILFALAYDMYDLPCSYTAHITNNLVAVISLVIRYNS